MACGRDRRFRLVLASAPESSCEEPGAVSAQRPRPLTPSRRMRCQHRRSPSSSTRNRSLGAVASIADAARPGATHDLGLRDHPRVHRASSSPTNCRNGVMAFSEKNASALVSSCWNPCGRGQEVGPDPDRPTRVHRRARTGAPDPPASAGAGVKHPAASANRHARAWVRSG